MKIIWVANNFDSATEPIGKLARILVDVIHGLDDSVEVVPLVYYTRHSDIEHECVLYAKAAGVWMDSFYSDTWLTAEAVHRHLEAGKRVCLVSPELHSRPYHVFWQMIKQNGFERSDRVALCTDKPLEAREYFYGE